jgi:thiol-disulfide isomerase/thioredoxin
MKRTWGIGCVVLAFMLTGCGMFDATKTTLVPVKAGQLPAVTMTSETIIAPQDRSAPVSLSGKDLSGQPLNVGDTRDRVTVVNFWATWCPPCIDEMPLLAQTATDLAGEPVTFVGVNVEDDPDAAQALGGSVPFRSIVDPSGSLLQTVPEVLPKSLPITLILDRQGRVAVRIIGPISPVTFPDTVRAVIAAEMEES